MLQHKTQNEKFIGKLGRYLRVLMGVISPSYMNQNPLLSLLLCAMSVIDDMLSIFSSRSGFALVL